MATSADGWGIGLDRAELASALGHLPTAQTIEVREQYRFVDRGGAIVGREFVGVLRGHQQGVRARLHRQPERGRHVASASSGIPNQQPPSGNRSVRQSDADVSRSVRGSPAKVSRSGAATK
ncbi:hypothetical protein ACF1BN_21380 [Streptomyces sp. NPDC014861]|uniref:hypothetical protein n=1 Tax=Streptomyces sp. NPDC014861 TaxID=3364923 RepID=UPI0036FB3594